MMSQLDRAFLEHLIRYNRIVQQRNMLLKQFAERGSIDRLQLASYHEPMAELGEKSIKRASTFYQILPHAFKPIMRPSRMTEKPCPFD